MGLASSSLGTMRSVLLRLSRGESINASWLVIAAICVYFVAYRFYALYITSKVLRVDPTRQRLPTATMMGWITCDQPIRTLCHHFAAIAGAGPLVGPVLPRRWDICPVLLDSRRRCLRRSGAGPHGAIPFQSS